MRKIKTLSYILGMVVVLAMASCQSNEKRQLVKDADPQEPVVINKTTTTRLEKVDEGVQSGMGYGFAWTTFNGVFITERPDVTADDPTSVLREETKVGGISRSTATVTPDTTYVDDFNNDVVYELTNTTEADLTSPDSIGASVTKTYSANDGAVLPVVDLYKYVAANVTLAIPHYEPSSQITGVRYEATADPDVRIVWTEITVTNKVVGTTQGTETTQVYEIGRYQKKAAAVDPVDPLRIKMNLLEMFRTYRKNTQHSIMDLWMSFTVVNAKTGETTDEVETDSRMAAKIGHFGAPSNGYSLEEKRLIGAAPTEVTEELDPDNEEAKNASKQIGKFNFQVDCYKQSYYVHFPVRGRDDSEGGKEAGGERLLFQLNGSYIDSDMDYRFDFQITHKTEVIVKGWQEITPSYQRPNDPGISYTYLSSYVVEFVDHFYLNGEEIVWVDTDEGVFYYLVPSQNGKKIEVNNPDYNLYYTGSDYHPFHTSNMIVDGWKPNVE
jgi:hypothetical protein